MHERCAVVGIYTPDVDVSRLIFFSLFSLQHRGQESSGIAVSDGISIKNRTGVGLVSHVFTEDEIANLRGDMGIGHNRYSTTGASTVINAQPVFINSAGLALAHNGNLVNSKTLQEELKQKGYSFHSSTDSEVIANLILASPGKDWEDKISSAMYRLQGAYSMTIMTADKLIAVRDPLGVRPLCLGSIDGGHVIASESCALDHIGARFSREIHPGEIVIIDKAGISSFNQKSRRKALCIFEYVYFARPDSTIHGKLVYKTRLAMGELLAKEYPVEADLVIGVPDSATAAGIGYSRASGIPYCEGLIKNRYVGRTFIMPDQRLRDLGVRLKFNPLSEIIAGKRLVVVDDSIVRGTTTPKVVALLRKAGAREVHLRICCPPIRHPCFLGVDMATEGELIAARKSISEIKEDLEADSLGYLSLDSLLQAVGLPRDTLCLACFNNDYPIPVQRGMPKLALETVLSPDR
jgi:amidophosphoribosyltransferase